MAKSPQEYIDELYKQGQNTANNLYSQRTQADEEFIKQVNDAIDRATSSSAKPYQTQIEQLPTQYQSLYDANAVQELVNRRQVQETMANMGLTDSGLNRTQQTAIALQRGNADAAARLSQQQKTQELQDKIAQIMETGAAQKQQQEASIRNNTTNWYNEMLNNLYNNAVQQGTSRYNAEQEAAAAIAAAEAEAKARIAEAEAKEKQQAFDNANSTVSTFIKLLDAGYSEEQALAFMRNSGVFNTSQTQAALSPLEEARQKYASSGENGLYDYLYIQILSGRLTEDQAILISNLILDSPATGSTSSPNTSTNKAWEANIMTRSEFNQRKRANSSSVAGYTNYDDYYAAMEKKFS